MKRTTIAAQEATTTGYMFLMEDAAKAAANAASDAVMRRVGRGESDKE